MPEYVSMLPNHHRLLDYSKLEAKVYGEELFDLHVMYSWDSYDGPLCGKAFTANIPELWFVCFRENYIEVPRADGSDPDGIRVRLFHAIKLDFKQRDLIDYWREEFDKYVKDKPREEHPKFYDPYDKITTKLVIDPAQVFGWFPEFALHGK